MKTLTALTFSMLYFLSSCIGSENYFHESNYSSSNKQNSFTLSYGISAPAELNISTCGGNIETSGIKTDSVIVEFIVSKNGKMLDITLDELNKLADIEIVYTSQKLQIDVKRTHERNLSIGFRIQTPNKTSTNLTTSGGNISVNNLLGEQSLSTSGGNIDLYELTGNIQASTSGGNVSLNKIKGNCNASTSGGNISMNKIDGKLNVSTSGGNINAADTKPELNASTSGGNINISHAVGTTDVNTSGGSIDLREIEGRMRAITSGGNISANINKLTNKLVLETSGGSIDATIPAGLGMDLDISADNIHTKLVNFTGTSKKERIEGQMNGGGILVQLSASGGNVSLDYK
jgi:hypothetical protein